MDIQADDDFDTFCPSDDQLVNRYLRAKTAGKTGRLPDSCYFDDADVCSARPDELVRDHGVPARVPRKEAGGGEQWFFFSPARFTGASMKRRSRTVDGTGDAECWHAEGRPRPVEGGGGFVQKFSYHVKVAPGVVEKPGWIMAEYTATNAVGEGDIVLCKIYRSPRGPGRNRNNESLAMSRCKSKRKAVEDLEAAASRSSSSSKRRIEEDEDEAMPFAEDKNDLMPVREDNAVAEPVFGEALDVQALLRELQLTPVFGEYTALLLTEEDVDDLVVLGLREGPEASYNQQVDYAVQAAHGPLTNGDVIASPANGVTPDEPLRDEVSCLCPNPSGVLCT